MDPVTLASRLTRPEPPALAPRQRVTLTPAGASRWRVLDAPGAIIGHLEARPTATGTRFAACRYQSMAGGFRDLGEFWSADDAVDCLRHG